MATLVTQEMAWNVHKLHNKFVRSHEWPSYCPAKLADACDRLSQIVN